MDQCTSKARLDWIHVWMYGLINKPHHITLSLTLYLDPLYLVLRFLYVNPSSTTYTLRILARVRFRRAAGNLAHARFQCLTRVSLKVACVPPDRER